MLLKNTFGETALMLAVQLCKQSFSNVMNLAYLLRELNIQDKVEMIVVLNMIHKLMTILNVSLQLQLLPQIKNIT